MKNFDRDLYFNTVKIPICFTEHKTMTEKELDDKIDKITDDYMKSKGIDPDYLDNLSDEEFKKLCSDMQIDAYLKGKLEGKK